MGHKPIEGSNPSLSAKGFRGAASAVVSMRLRWDRIARHLLCGAMSAVLGACGAAHSHEPGQIPSNCSATTPLRFFCAALQPDSSSAATAFAIGSDSKLVRLSSRDRMSVARKPARQDFRATSTVNVTLTARRHRMATVSAFTPEPSTRAAASDDRSQSLGSRPPRRDRAEKRRRRLLGSPEPYLDGLVEEWAAFAAELALHRIPGTL